MNAHLYAENDVVYVEGELNFLTVVNLWKDSLPIFNKQKELCIDLSKVTSANSASISLLLEWLKHANKLKKNISFKNIPTPMMSLANISGVGSLLKAQ